MRYWHPIQTHKYPLQATGLVEHGRQNTFELALRNMALALLRKPWWGLRTIKTALVNNHTVILMATSACDPPPAVTTTKPPVDPCGDAQAVNKPPESATPASGSQEPKGCCLVNY